MSIKKHSNATLYLYAFLGLLFGVVATVDVSSMASQAMSHQQAYIDDATRGL